MTEYIKKEDAIEALMPYFMLPIHTKKQYEQAKSIATTIINSIPLENRLRWIPVSERLPKKGEGEEVLITVDALFRQLYVATYTYHGWDFVEGVFDDEKVLAWMPLPEPYGERKEDETR